MTAPCLPTALCLTVLAVTAGCGQADPSLNPSAEPTTAPQTSIQMSPSDSDSADPAPESLHVLVLGDSIATGSESTAGSSYGAVYADLLKQQSRQPVEIANLADPSETSGSLLTSLELPELQEAVAASDVIVITVGGNDGDPFASYSDGICAAGGDPAACISAYAPHQEKNLDQILTAIQGLRGSQSTVIRLTSPDYNPFIGVDRITDVPRFPKDFGLTFFRQVAEAETQNACRVAAAHGAACADFLHVFNGPQGNQPATAYLAEDHLHPSEAGQQAIARALMATGLAPLD